MMSEFVTSEDIDRIRSLKTQTFKRIAVNAVIVNKVREYLAKYDCGESVQQTDSGQEDAINLMADIADFVYEMEGDEDECHS